MEFIERRADGSSGRLVRGDRHMVSAGHHAAATAALLVLEAGGNAVDAGVAAGLVLGVVQCDIVNVAGVAPIMIRNGKSGSVVTIDGLGVWPAAASARHFRDAHGGAIPKGLLRTVVPAAPASWIEALVRFGTMSFGDVAQAAIRLARDGFPVHPTMADFVAKYAADYTAYSDNATLFLRDGKPVAVGASMKQPDLAATLTYMADQERVVSAKGREAGLKAARDAFYRGDIASRIADYHAANGGWLTFDDLARYAVRLEAPVVTSWRGVELYNCGPWCQGPAMAQAITILGDTDLCDLGHNSPTYVHLLTEVMKLTFADREATYGDPRFVDVPLSHMLSGEYGARQRARIDPSRAIPGMPAAGIGKPAIHAFASGRGEPALSPDTSYVAVVDRWGNAFSATPSDTSNDTPIIPGLGICPSSRGSQSFTIEGHPSEVGPGAASADTQSGDRCVRWRHGDAVRLARRRRADPVDAAGAFESRRVRHGSRQRHRGTAVRDLQLPGRASSRTNAARLRDAQGRFPAAHADALRRRRATTRKHWPRTPTFQRGGAGRAALEDHMARAA